MQAHDPVLTPPDIRASGASDTTHIVLTFDNNRLASALFGQFDQNLALIEQKLGVDARARGNQVALRGEASATDQARRTLDFLYDRLQAGSEVGAVAHRSVFGLGGVTDDGQHAEPRGDADPDRLFSVAHRPL